MFNLTVNASTYEESKIMYGRKMNAPYGSLCDISCSDPTSDGQASVLKCHPWIGMLTHIVLE